MPMRRDRYAQVCAAQSAAFDAYAKLIPEHSTQHRNKRLPTPAAGRRQCDKIFYGLINLADALTALQARHTS
jgi:hypothetical protein